MGNNRMLVEERQTDIGKFLVGRLLPFRKKRQVGPFTFIDHMGPSKLGPDNYLDVDQHPHIGLSTLTYLLEGEIEHRDSTGAVQIISPGDVGFMSSGKGVCHTERTPKHLRNGEISNIHGYQVWVALPKEMEEMEPRFDFIPKAELPHWQENHIDFTLIAGKGFNRTSPLPVHSSLFMVNVQSTEETCLEICDQLEGEIAIVVTRGEIHSENQIIRQGQMLISKTDNECKITLTKDSRILLFGGPALPEPRYLYWNFVSTSKERLERAKEEWKEKRFPSVPDDQTYIAMPEPKF